MNFSESFEQTHQLCKFSPDGKYVANCVQYRLIIRDVKTLQIKALYTCLDSVDCMEWSSDSLFILCGMFKRALVQVWSLEQPNWYCKIDEGVAGLEAVKWSPDGRHILSMATLQIRISIWSLIDKSVAYMRYPKYANQGLDFTKDGKYMALAERRNCKDYISIIACDSWQLLKNFETETNDLADLAWSPNGRVLAVWESNLEYKLLLYSLDGRLLSAYSRDEIGLGLKSVRWCTTGQFIAIGSYSQMVRLLNNISWGIVAEYYHKMTINDSSIIVYKEIEKKPVMLPWESRPKGPLTSPSHYEPQSIPFQVPSVKPNPEKANPRLGVGLILFSHDNKYMATKNDNMPNVVWIWDFMKLNLIAMLVQVHAVKSMQWDPKQARLALCTGTNKIYMWSPAGCLSVEVITDVAFNVIGLQWHKDGNGLIVSSRNRFCTCYLGGPH